MTMQFLLLLVCGAVGGGIFVVLHIPGGAMLGAVVAVLALKLSGTLAVQTPPIFQTCAQIAIGVVVGNMLTSQALTEIRNMAGLMALSTFILIAAGFASSWIISRQTGMDAASSILASSPGGLQAVVGLASDMGTQAPAVMAFQMVRLYAVVLLAPLISWLLHHFMK